MTSLQAAERWNITKRQVNSLCRTGRIPGAVRQGQRWMIPAEYTYAGRNSTRNAPAAAPAFPDLVREPVSYAIPSDADGSSCDTSSASCNSSNSTFPASGVFPSAPGWYDSAGSGHCGKFINPGCESFRTIRCGEYIDKSDMIAFVNSCLDTPRKLICVSRPRRFGKSFTTKMLCAYYCRSCDSSGLFPDLKIAASPSFREHLNRYDVLYLDITLFLSTLPRDSSLIDSIESAIIRDLEEYYGVRLGEQHLVDALRRLQERNGRKLLLIIDEWDAIFRECREQPEIQNLYIMLLRSLFKSSLTDRLFAGVYMTGILPIKKYGHESAVSDFYEFTMIDPRPLQSAIGFTADEVKALCAEHGMDFAEMKQWYDGYHVGNLELYNPKSVMEAILRNHFSNYWTKTETYEALRDYIDMNFDGLKDAVIGMLGGEACEVDTGSFQNDMTSMRSRDDVLTLLIHLGYLAYEEDHRTVSIPNAEIREEFVRAIRGGSRKELMRAVQRSDAILAATWDMDSDRVAELISEVHDEETDPHFYNNEQALRNVVKMAYLSGADHYIRLEEVPAGRGYADMVFWPRPGSDRPALIVELKWNRSESQALQQIRDRKYPKLFSGFPGNVLLVGLAYDAGTKEHTCRIDRYRYEEPGGLHLP